jgi:broad-specificity NMP kinase
MKRLILIIGPNGVGKSTASAELFGILPRAAYVEADALRWFFDPGPEPSQPCDETIALRRENLYAVTRNYLASPIIDTVILPYGLHGYRAALLQGLLADLQAELEFELVTVLLDCSRDENIRRMRVDGRDAQRIARSLDRSRSAYAGARDMFPGLICIDTTKLTPHETAAAIAELMK